jgi:hypothetical protein
VDGAAYAEKTLTRLGRRLAERDAERAAEELLTVGRLLAVAGRRQDAATIWALLSRGPLALHARHPDRQALEREASDERAYELACDPYAESLAPHVASNLAPYRYALECVRRRTAPTDALRALEAAQTSRLSRFERNKATLLAAYCALRTDDHARAVQHLRTLWHRDGDELIRAGEVFRIATTARAIRDGILADSSRINHETIDSMLEGVAAFLELPDRLPPPSFVSELERLVAAEHAHADAGNERAVSAAEERLGARLPPSYRIFLLVHDGLSHFGMNPLRLRPARELAWFRDENAEWIDAWTSADAGPETSEDDYRVYGSGQSSASMRSAYLSSALQISDADDGAVYLLNPKVRAADGEWEAWLFASWLPGAQRFRSFREMVVRRIAEVEDY